MKYIVTFYGANGYTQRILEDCVDEAYAEMRAENIAQDEELEIIGIERYFGFTRPVERSWHF